jgi:hypothetical protein
MKTESRGASGQIELWFRSEESASTHRYKSAGAWLRALDDNTLVLEGDSFRHEAHSGREDGGTAGIAISVSELVKLVRKHGKVVGKSKPAKKKFRKRSAKQR